LLFEFLEPLEITAYRLSKDLNTPLLIQHGDADEAVPWYQAIELYLAMRRLGKDSVFLHYYNEPHHLRQFANRLDYAIKMKEYMDHYLKGTPAPKWITEGVPYLGE
jgi:dipeptidyl aminopeptidase/acylaminoacyl peptidase